METNATRLGLLYAVLTVITLLPLIVVPMPGLGDFTNHLARIHVMMEIGHSPDLQRFYEPGWRVAPYFGMDLVVGALARVMPIYIAGRIFLALCVLMPPAAAAAVRYAASGRVGMAPAFGFLVSYNYLLARGFTDYLFSAGLALGLFALWVATSARGGMLRVLAFAFAVTGIYLAHAFALIVFCLTVAGFEIGRARQVAFKPWRAIALRWAAAASTALPALAVAMTFRAHLEFGAAQVTRYGDLVDKLGAAFSPFYFPGTPLVTALFALVPLLALIYSRERRIGPRLGGAVLVVAIGAACTPRVLFNLWGADFRLPLIAVILTLAALVTTGVDAPRRRILVTAALTLLMTIRAADAGLTMVRLNVQAQAVLGVVSQLPRGQRVLVVDGDEGTPRLDRMAGHLGLIATIERDAFVPFLFSYVTPLQLRGDMVNSGSPNGRALDYDQLREGVAPAPAGELPAFGSGGQKYWLGWPEKFDYVLILHPSWDAGPLPPLLRKVASNAVAELYEVTREGGGNARVR